MPQIIDLYGGGESGKLMRERFRDSTRGAPKPKVQQVLQKQHTNGNNAVDDDGWYHCMDSRGHHSWKVPKGLLYYWDKPLRINQMVVMEPWYATWRSPKTGRRLRKMFQSLPRAIHFVATRAQYVDPHASIVSKQGYDIPPVFRGKLPYKTVRGTWYWCPHCVTARKFFRVSPEQQFWALKKTWREAKGRYEYLDRHMRLLACKYCGCTNRNHIWRRSNQPWEMRKFKPGARRAKKREDSSSSSTTRRRRLRR